MSKRLAKELKEFVDEPKDWCRATCVQDKLFLWHAEVLGPDGTAYEKGIFKLEIDIPPEYPFKPPKVKFLTKIYHPNVKSDGSFCTDILTSEGWSPQLKLQQVLLTIRQLLQDPNLETPLSPEVAELYKTDKQKFLKMAKETTKQNGSTKWTL